MSIELSGLTPVFKWTGGKRRELPTITQYLPSFVNDGEDWKFVEPFVGGGAVYFALANPNSFINDFDVEVVNFYEVMASQDKKFLKEVERVAGLFVTGDRDAQANAYYELRNLDRDGGLNKTPKWKRAARFYVVNQLAFSGMRRFNSKGEFNVPFGHYKSFNASKLRSKDHIDLLANTQISCGSYEHVLEVVDTDRTFVFIDPPYTRVMKKYSADNEFGDDAQRKLAERLIGMKNASWMVVIDKSPLTEELYGDYIVHSYDVSYGVNIKNRFSQDAEHIVVCNY